MQWNICRVYRWIIYSKIGRKVKLRLFVSIESLWVENPLQKADYLHSFFFFFFSFFCFFLSYFFLLINDFSAKRNYIAINKWKKCWQIYHNKIQLPLAQILQRDSKYQVYQWSYQVITLQSQFLWLHIHLPHPLNLLFAFFDFH